MSHVSHTNDPWLFSGATSQVTRVNEWNHIHEWVMSHIKRPVTRQRVSRKWEILHMEPFWHMDYYTWTARCLHKGGKILCLFLVSCLRLCVCVFVWAYLHLSLCLYLRLYQFFWSASVSVFVSLSIYAVSSEKANCPTVRKYLPLVYSHFLGERRKGHVTVNMIMMTDPYRWKHALRILFMYIKYMHRSMHMYMDICVHIHIYIYVPWVCLFACPRSRVCACVCAYVCVCVCVCVCVWEREREREWERERERERERACV